VPNTWRYKSVRVQFSRLLKAVNSKRTMFVSFVVVFVFSVFTPSLGKPLYYPDDSYDDGDSLVEHVLSSQEKAEDDELDELELPANGELFEGDMIMDDHLRRTVWGAKSKKSAVRYNYLKKLNRVWEDKVIIYEISDDFGPEHRKMLRQAMNEYVNRTCIRFRKRTNETNYVFFTMGKDMCASSVGMTGGKQNITLGVHCGVLGTFEHEIMHALGFVHEHSRPDRDDYIKINFTNIKKKEWDNFKKYPNDLVDSFKMDFNFASIMLYRNDAFSKNGKDTITSVDEPKLKFGQRKEFSAGDVEEINTLYKCTDYLKNPNYHGLIKT